VETDISVPRGTPLELMWLTDRLAPDLKTIADFRHDLPRKASTSNP